EYRSIMLFVTPAEDIRMHAQSWLARAAGMPPESWDRERLITAAKLNEALARRIEWQRSRAKEGQLSCRAAAPDQNGRIRPPASCQTSEPHAATRHDPPRSAGSATSS